MPCQWIGNTNIIKTSILPKAMRKRLGSDWTQTSGVPKAHQGQIMTEKGQEQVLRCRNVALDQMASQVNFTKQSKKGPLSLKVYHPPTLVSLFFYSWLISDSPERNKKNTKQRTTDWLLYINFPQHLHFAHIGQKVVHYTFPGVHTPVIQNSTTS